VLVNSIYVPDNGATAQVANDLVGRLIVDGFDVSVVCTSRDYKPIESETRANGKVYRIRHFKLGSSKLMRLASAMLESYLLLKKARRFNADFHIICTDPPLLNLFSALMLRAEKWALWTMDLYPEAFVANSLAAKGNALYKGYKKIVNKLTPTVVLYLGLRQKEFVASQNDFRDVPFFVLPCGVKYSGQLEKRRPQWKKSESKIYFGYSGNLGEAHSPEFLKKMISLCDPDKHQFILSIFGANAELITRFAADKKNVLIVEWISPEEMTYLDIQVVTLKKEWTHICVPSKAVSSICYELPFVFHGEKSGDIYHQYAKALWHIDCHKETSEMVENFFSKLTREEIMVKKQEAIQLKNKLLIREKNSYDQFSNYLKNE